ncbi:flagellar basal-body MS-ring/collar protein FliF [Paenibacillus crassostreae]|uniref:Flagellar M-ring protein n=1 Tax=Paenibacillus crassostreae TaxID=1763538 RepID=A0A167FNQ3_9BACL|nr:flagellar basal-body MS-ring/collar protein FliF [Paenibacillus crassostreae]AOZ94217.1 flagellar M-ring protein FliF [Paenibacillus crassostreae]OAB76747.1 flagellar M-ring protein FliF [Paenibacillus crassostreae]
MNERIVQYKDKVVRYWNQFSKNQKIIFVSTLSIIVIVIVILTMMFSKTEYEVAFKDLNSTDAAGIMTYLDDNSIPYKLSPDGGSISVPSTQAARAKVDIGSQGIVENGSIGYKIFEQGSSVIGMTDSEFGVKYNNALNGEVEQLLKSMNGIRDAKVLINLPEKSVFASNGDQDKASASAVLIFNAGFKPNQEAIDGYYNLMKTAIPNLPIENITISNDEIELVSTAKGGEGVLSTALEANYALQKRFENDVRQNVKQFLTQFMGEDKVEVLVVSKLNFDKIQSQENLVTPVNEEDMKGIEISVQNISNNYSGTTAPDSGVAGVGQEEIPGYPSDTSTGNTTSEELSETVNYEVNRIAREIISSPYSVKDLTINVAVEPPDGQENLDAATITAIQTILKNIVRASVADSGITYTNDELDQKVSVYSQTFNSGEDVSTGIKLSNGALWAIGLVVLVLLGLVGFLIYKRRKQKDEFEEDVPLQVPTEFPSINLESMTNESQVRKQLETLAKKKPDEFVNLLRTWLADE